MCKKFLFSVFILVFSCSNIKTIEKKEVRPVEPTIEATPLPMNSEISPGKITLVELISEKNLIGKTVICGGKKVIPFMKEEKTYFFVGETYFSRRRSFTCYLGSEQKGQKLVSFKVVPYQYPFEKLNVDKKRVFLSKKDLARVVRERKILSKVYEKSFPEPLFEKAFEVPLDSKITSIYGSKRLFNNKKQSQHLGWDFRAAIGVPIPVTNDGVVVYTGNLFYSGNVVIVDHGVGIFSIYGHLSKIMVKTGDKVIQGQIVGKAGATGRVSGPHLHWGVKINGDNLDGISLVNASKKIFND